MGVWGGGGGGSGGGGGWCCFFFFFNDTATTEIYTLSLHDALPIYMFAAEASSAVRRSGAEAHLLGFDTEVHFRGRMSHADAMGGISMRSGGGTDYGDALEEAEALAPSMIIMLTDLDAPTAFRVSVPFLWAVPVQPRIEPKFGEFLVIGDFA